MSKPGCAGKICVIVGTVTNDVRLLDVPKLKVRLIGVRENDLLWCNVLALSCSFHVFVCLFCVYVMLGCGAKKVLD